LLLLVGEPERMDSMCFHQVELLFPFQAYVREDSTDQEYREVKKSYLSVLLSGTPAQVKPLIPSTENGLFSRQLFYYMHGIWAWINQFERTDR